MTFTGVPLVVQFSEVERIQKWVLREQPKRKITIELIRRKFRLRCDDKTVKVHIMDAIHFKYVLRARKPTVPKQGRGRGKGVHRCSLLSFTFQRCFLGNAYCSLNMLENSVFPPDVHSFHLKLCSCNT